MTPEERKTIADKIRALRAKATNIASTEAEAQQAAAMVAKLLTRYDLTDQDVEDYAPGKTSAVQGEMLDRLSDVLRACWSGITALTETHAYLSPQGTLCFIGVEHDVEMALYLSEVIDNACNRALRAGFKGADAKQRKSFAYGFGRAVHIKLKGLADERRRAKTSVGTAIVVCKTELVSAFENDAGLKLRSGRKTRRIALDGAYYEAGQQVGGTVNINRPLSGGNKTERIV